MNERRTVKYTSERVYCCADIAMVIVVGKGESTQILLSLVTGSHRDSSVTHLKFYFIDLLFFFSSLFYHHHSHK